MGYNKFPLWKNVLIIIIVLIGILYSLPNLFGEDYAIQIATASSEKLNPSILDTVKQDLNKSKI